MDHRHSTIVDLAELGQQATGRTRKVLMNGPRFHTWLHVYAPGDRDDMHCHNADQTFYCVAGECTMHFPDGGRSVLRPGMVALIPGGTFYQLENAAEENMVLMGNRALSQQVIQHINYETREDHRAHEQEPAPTGTRILV